MDFYNVQMKNAYSSKTRLLNLGCGTCIVQGWTNVDRYPGDGVDRVVDLNGPWPWEDESVQEIFSAHTIEHVDDCIHFMKEAHRILAPGGHLTVRCPFGFNEAAMGDPTHKRPFFPSTFVAFQNGYDIRNTRSRQQDPSRWNFTWEILELTVAMSDWVRKVPFWRFWALKLMNHINGIGSEIRVIYKKPETKLQGDLQ